MRLFNNWTLMDGTNAAYLLPAAVLLLCLLFLCYCKIPSDSRSLSQASILTYTVIFIIFSANDTCNPSIPCSTKGLQSCVGNHIWLLAIPLLQFPNCSIHLEQALSHVGYVCSTVHDSPGRNSPNLHVCSSWLTIPFS